MSLANTRCSLECLLVQPLFALGYAAYIVDKIANIDIERESGTALSTNKFIFKKYVEKCEQVIEAVHMKQKERENCLCKDCSSCKPSAKQKCATISYGKKVSGIQVSTTSCAAKCYIQKEQHYYYHKDQHRYCHCQLYQKLKRCLEVQLTANNHFFAHNILK